MFLILSSSPFFSPLLFLLIIAREAIYFFHTPLSNFINGKNIPLVIRAARTTRSLASGTAICDVVETYTWFRNGSSTFSEYGSRNAADGSMKEPLFLRNSRKLSSFAEHFLILFIILMTKAFLCL